MLARASLRVLFLGTCLLLPTRYARAEGNKAACGPAYESAQELRAAGKLREASDQLVICAQQICPSFVETDCAQWLTEVRHALPTVVVAAKDPKGEDTIAVRILIDGETVKKELDGIAFAVNPGTHQFRFELEGAEPIEKQIVLQAGEKDRIISVSFPPPVGAPSTAPAEPAHDVPAAPPVVEDTPHEGAKPGPLRRYAFVAGGVGVAGIAGFAILGAVGRSKQSQLEASGCSPNCSPDEVGSVRTKYILADVSLGVGIAGLGAGIAMFFLSQPKADAPESTAGVSLDVKTAPGLTYASLSGRF